MDNVILTKKQYIPGSPANTHAIPYKNTAAGQKQEIRQILKGAAVQPKLYLDKADSPAENEADQVAEQLVSRKEEEQPEVIREQGAMLQRQALPEEEEERVAAKRVPGTNEQSSEQLETAVSSLRGCGQPLPGSERAFFESRLNHDLSAVRIHTDWAANSNAKALQAKAYTHGTDIVFGSNQYAPQSDEGKKLLAHELVHVVQQNNE